MLSLFLHGLSFLLGAFFGVALMCILQTGKKADAQMKIWKPTQKEQDDEK